MNARTVHIATASFHAALGTALCWFISANPKTFLHGVFGVLVVAIVNVGLMAYWLRRAVRE